MFKFRMPFGSKKSAATSSASESYDEWLKDYIGLDDDDEEDEDEDEEEDEIDFVFSFGEGLFDDEDDSESMDADDAAYAWMSRGKDEDYMFGYSEEELENS